MKLHAIETGNIKLDGGAMFGVVPKSIWSKLYESDKDNLTNWAMRSLLIVQHDRRILIDTGTGDKQGEDFFKHYHLNGQDTLESSLQKVGYTLEDITDVIQTHLHFDHCGGSVKYDENQRLVTTFPNATYHISRKQWEWATHPNRREQASFLEENILPIEACGQLHLVEQDGALFPDLSIRLYDGHTDGQLIPFIRYKDKTIVYTADFIPSYAHVHVPFVPAYDTKPLLSLAEKEAFLEEAVDQNYIFFFLHDIRHECCTVQKTAKGYRAKEMFPLSSVV